MKKTLIVIGIILFLLVGFALTSNNLTSSAFQYETIQQSSLVVSQNVLGQVCGEETILYFNGNVSQIFKPVGTQVNAKEILLSYNNEYGKKTNFVSPKSGYVKEIGNGYIIVLSNDFFIETYVSYPIYNLLVENQEAILKLNNQDYLLTLKEKFPLPFYINGQYQYKLHYECLTCQNLLPLQEVLLTISFETKTGFCVSNKAIYKDEDGYFLLESSFQKDLNHYENHKVEIEVIYSDENYSIIEGIGLEDLEVCILDEFVKKALLND